MGNGDYTVFVSRNHKFKYYDDKISSKLSNEKSVEFVPPIKKVDMKLPEFMKRLKDWKKGQER